MERLQGRYDYDMELQTRKRERALEKIARETAKQELQHQMLLHILQTELESAETL